MKIETFIRLLLMALVICVFLSSFISSKQVRLQTNSNEVIISFEKLGEKQVQELDEVIAQIPGVKNFGFCQKLRLYFFSYDALRYKTEEEVVETIAIYTKKFEPLQKVGTSSSRLIQQCNN